ncbi:MAG: HAMP domain-containing histidine kinase [Oscillospiraceae bacterium]|nr:HAMP domain-containing histidine kinase [Oscillospiraceae bacterium]
MWIRKSELKKLSADIRRIIDGQDIDLRDNCEGAWGILKNDIHTLANLKNEQVSALSRERDVMKDTLTNISHQLKTPLTSMMIMADLLENALAMDNPPPDKQAEFLSNIKIGLTRMEWLATALLKMAKLDAGVIEFSKELIQSDALVTLALEPLQILLEIKNQRVEVSGEAALICDKRWTAEALTNTIKNASEHSPNGGEIRIASGKNPICSWISVTDSGEGIHHTKIAGLFKRFEGSRSDKGYGIGLPLALAIMRGQNGDIEVDGGGKGTGATFTLKLY